MSDLIRAKITIILEALGITELSPDLMQQLEQAAYDYFGVKTFESRELVTMNKQRHEQLDKLIAATERLEKALQGLDIETWTSLEKNFPINLDIDLLSQLKLEAQRSKTEFPTRGYPASHSRFLLAKDLKRIYEQTTGIKATRSHDTNSELDSGKFLDFVRAFLSIIDPDARKGIEQVIREALKS